MRTMFQVVCLECYSNEKCKRDVENMTLNT